MMQGFHPLRKNRRSFRRPWRSTTSICPGRRRRIRSDRSSRRGGTARRHGADASYALDSAVGVRALGRRAASTGWSMSEDLPHAEQSRDASTPTAASSCTIDRTTSRRTGSWSTETKRILRRLGFWHRGHALARQHEHDAPVRHAVLRHRSAHLRARSLLPRARRREPVRRRCLVLSFVRGRESRVDDRSAGAAGRRSHQGHRTDESAIVQPWRHHRLELQPGGAVLLGDLRLSAGRRRRHAAGSRAHVLRRRRPSTAAARSAGFACREARCSRSSSSSRSCRRTPIPWNRVGLTHIWFNVRNLQKWYDYLQAQGRRVRQQAGAVAARPLVLLRQGLRRQPDRADGSRLHVLRAQVARPAGRLDLPSGDVQEVLRVVARGSRPAVRGSQFAIRSSLSTRIRTQRHP